MNWIELTQENIQQQHICCAIGSSADAKGCEASKKQWMLQAFPYGYRFYRPDVRGKAFIETIPAEFAWCPIQAPNWLFIDCFWVSGALKGQGIASHLLHTAKEQALAEGKLGLVALTSNKKKPFLSDPGFYKKKGFVPADTAPPYYELVCLPLAGLKPENTPRFSPSVKQSLPHKPGIHIFYSHHCPHTSKYVPLLEKIAHSMKVPFVSTLYTSFSEAQAGPNPFTSYAMFHSGQFVTNEIFSETKFEKYLKDSFL